MGDERVPATLAEEDIDTEGLLLSLKVINGVISGVRLNVELWELVRVAVNVWSLTSGETSGDDDVLREEETEGE